MIRIAAVGDVHVDADVIGRFRPALDKLSEVADALLGDPAVLGQQPLDLGFQVDLRHLIPPR